MQWLLASHLMDRLCMSLTFDYLDHKCFLLTCCSYRVSGAAISQVEV